MSTGRKYPLDKATDKEVLRLLKKYCKGTGLKPEVMLAQMRLESGNFSSGLAKNNFNFSGHKTILKSIPNKTEGEDYTIEYTNEHATTEEEAKAYKKKKEGEGWHVKSITEETDANGDPRWVIRLGQPFNKYKSIDDAVRNHIDFLTGDGKLTGKKYTAHKDRYKPIIDAQTVEEQIEALHKSPYSTDTTYSDSLTDILSNEIPKQFPEYKPDATALTASVSQSIDETFAKYDKHIKALENSDNKTLNDYDHDVVSDLRLEMFGSYSTARTSPKDEAELLKALQEKDKVEAERLKEYVENKKQKTKEHLEDKDVEYIQKFLEREEKGITQVYVNTNPGGRDTRVRGPHNLLDSNDRILGFDDAMEMRQKTNETLDAIILNKDGRFTLQEVAEAKKYKDSLAKSQEDAQDILDAESENKQLYQDRGVAGRDILRKRKPYIAFKNTHQEANQFFTDNDIFTKLDESYDVTAEGEVVDPVEEEVVEPEGFTGPDGKFYPYQTVEAGEEDTITTEGLVEPLDTEVTLEGEPGGEERVLTPLEEHELNLLKKQERREKWSNIAKGLGDVSKAAGVALMAGAGLKSMFEATKKHKINKIRVSPLMEEAFQKAKNLSTQGMTYAERSAAMADLNNAYAGAMKNVMAISGGQRSTALANMGVVDASRVNALVDLAGKDAALRRDNMKMYQEQAKNIGQMQLTADSTNEQLRATLEEGRKTRLAKIGDNLFSEAAEFTRNLADQKNNKDLVDMVKGVKTNISDLDRDLDLNQKKLDALIKQTQEVNQGIIPGEK